MIRISFFCVLLAGLSLSGATAEARVFSFGDSSFAAYFRGTGGMSMMGQEAFSLSSGDTFFENKDKPNYNYSGEIGIMMAFGERSSLRIGVEGVQSREVDAPGFGSTGAHLLNVNSKIVSFVPNMTLEIDLSEGPASKTFLFLGAGYATVKLTNEYDINASGAYGAVADYKETVSGFALSGHAGLGFEFLFVDNCTLALELGWRHLVANELEYSESVTTVNGAVTKGSTARNSDGAKRIVDMSGPFAGLALRFYIPSLN